MSVRFHFLLPVSLKERKKLKAFLSHIVAKEKRHLQQLDFIFCSDEYLLEINKNFLHHNFYTDIITFDLGTNSEQINGEIYISVQRVKENATVFKTSFTSELHRVIFHGVLHLCGYKDKSSQHKKIMTSKEDFYLDQYRSFHVEQS